jgi:hypothetical protein
MTKLLEEIDHAFNNGTDNETQRKRRRTAQDARRTYLSAAATDR